MVKLLRLAAALVIAVTAMFAGHRLAYLPWRADVERKRIETITFALWERRPPFASVRARQNISDARGYLDRGIDNTGLYMAAAANYRLLDDFGHAAEMYRRALRYDRRPELYFHLGLMEINLGHRQAGIDMLIRAALFNPFLIQEIDENEIREKVEKAVHARRYLPWLDQPSVVHQ